MNEFQRFNTVLSKITQSIVWVYQFIAAGVFIASLILGSTWIRKPFIGGFLEQTLVLNDSQSQSDTLWTLYEAGFNVGDQLISVKDQPVTDTEDLDRILSSSVIGETVSVEMRTPEGEIRQAEITLRSFPVADRIAYFAVQAFLSLVFLLISLWIFGLRRTEPAGRAFSILATSLAIVTGSLFDLYTTHKFTFFWTMAGAFCGGALIDLGLCFPQESRLLYRRPYLRWFGYVIGVGLIINAGLNLYDFENPTAYFGAWQLIYAFVGISALSYFAALAYRAIWSHSPIVKSQAGTILLGALFGFGPVVVWLLFSGQSFNPYLFLPMILFPLANDIKVRNPICEKMGDTGDQQPIRCKDSSRQQRINDPLAHPIVGAQETETHDHISIG
ncbi:MAG TPA: hypothetical protein VHP14_01965, partial [Anaerolineales bacterium]|nr:hypothetical protein [Anaerolineales bacterium]